MKRAFTLIELLVVIAIIGILSAVVLVSLNSSRDNARISRAQAFESHIYRTNPNLVAEWKFDEGSGTIAYDTSGNENHLNQVNGSPTWSEDSPYGNGWSLGTTGGSDRRGTFQGFPTQEITVSAWVKIDEAGTYPDFVRHEWMENAGGWLLSSVGSTMTPIFGVMANATQQNNAGGGVMSLATWHHLVGTYENGNVKLYLDGVLVDSRTYPAVTLDGSGLFRVGSGSPSQFVDQVRIYSEALNVATVQDLYESEKGSYLVIE